MLAFLLLAAPAAAAPDLTGGAYAGRVLAEVNRVRTRPKAVAAELRRFAAGFRDRLAPDGEDEPGRLTVEGPAAVREAAERLEAQPPLPPLTPAPVLARAARLLVAEQERTGQPGHYTAAGRGPGDRARAVGGDIYVTEVIAYGFRSPAEAVRQLVVDDGVARRGHRVLLLAPRARYAGVACAEHPTRLTACSVVLSETPDGRPALPAAGP